MSSKGLVFDKEKVEVVEEEEDGEEE